MKVLLCKDPKVLQMADFLTSQSEFVNWMYASRDTGVTCHVTDRVTVSIVVTGLLSAWGIAREYGVFVDENSVIKKATVATISRLCEIPKFGEAMASVGWLRYEEDLGVVFPNCLENISSPEEVERSKAAERKRKQRDKERAEKESQKVTDASRDSHAEVTHREEKIREENKKDIPPNPQGGNGDGKRKRKQDDTPYQEILESFQTHLPMLPQPQDPSEWTGERKAKVRARHNEKRDKKDFWSRYFAYVAKSKFLTGQTVEEFEATFDWLIKPANMQKVIEKNYHKDHDHG